MTRPSHHHTIIRPDFHELWPLLSHDQPIALVNERGWRLSGKVETVTKDRECLWIQLDGGMGRQLIHHQDGFELDDGNH